MNTTTKTNRRLQLETMEDRSLMSATAGIVDGFLNVTGSDQADTISITREWRTSIRNGVRQSLWGASVKELVPVSGGTSLREVGWFRETSFNVIQVQCLGGNDKVTNSSRYTSRMDGGPGRDTLIGGSGGDLILGGSENDIIVGGLGNDWLFGGSDNDEMYGDTQQIQEHLASVYGGNDLLSGGAGQDILFGGAGTDALLGGNINNDPSFTMTFLPGFVIPVASADFDYFACAQNDLATDQMFGHQGDDFLDGGGGFDIYDGGAGSDVAVRHLSAIRSSIEMVVTLPAC
jgi:Ca2+-binding RTX toxin-like protein